MNGLVTLSRMFVSPRSVIKGVFGHVRSEQEARILAMCACWLEPWCCDICINYIVRYGEQSVHLAAIKARTKLFR